MVIAADDLGDAHVPVVHHHAEVIGGGAVGPGDDEVVQLAVADLDAALDQVVPGHHAVHRVLEAHHRLDAGRRGWAGSCPAPGASGRRSGAFRPWPAGASRICSSSSGEV